MKNRMVSISLAVTLLLSVGLISCGGEQVPEITQYNLAISSTEGGSVTAPGEGTSIYDEGDVVNLVAEADEGYSFINWTGDVDTIADVDNAATTITVQHDYSVTANFERQGYDLSGSWTLYMTPENGVEQGPYCIYIRQSGTVFEYADWHKVYYVHVNGSIDGADIVSSGESTYYGDGVSYSARAITTNGNTMTGTYNYTGAYDEKGDFTAERGACKTARGWVRVCNIRGDYALDFYVSDLIDDGISITSATVTGPNVDTLDLDVGEQTSYWLEPTTQPQAADIYTFNVSYGDGAIATTTAYVRETYVDSPTDLSPADGDTTDTAPTFSWEAPPCGCQGYYRIWIVDCEGEDVWSVYVPKETTSVTYSFDGKGNVLESGETYEWRLIAFDEPISGGPDNNVWVFSTFTVQ